MIDIFCKFLIIHQLGFELFCTQTHPQTYRNDSSHNLLQNYEDHNTIYGPIKINYNLGPSCISLLLDKSRIYQPNFFFVCHITPEINSQIITITRHRRISIDISNKKVEIQKCT